jgi:hypothetical protein
VSAYHGQISIEGNISSSVYTQIVPFVVYIYIPVIPRRCITQQLVNSVTPSNIFLIPPTPSTHQITRLTMTSPDHQSFGDPSQGRATGWTWLRDSTPREKAAFDRVEIACDTCRKAKKRCEWKKRNQICDRCSSKALSCSLLETEGSQAGESGSSRKQVTATEGIESFNEIANHENICCSVATL